MNTLSIHRPRPSIEIRNPAAASVPVNAALVNWVDSSGRRNTMLIGLSQMPEIECVLPPLF